MPRCSRRKARSTGSKAFASEHGPRFYGLPLNEGTVTLVREAVEVPERVAGLVPFHAGERLEWRFAASRPHRTKSRGPAASRDKPATAKPSFDCLQGGRSGQARRS